MTRIAARLAAELVVLLGLALGLSGCGWGTATVVAATQSSENEDPPIELILADSEPRLSRTMVDPFSPGFVNTSQIDPGTSIVLAFSQDLAENSAENASIELTVKHPTAGFHPVPFELLPIQPPTRRLTLKLDASTQLNGLYRIRMSGIVEAGAGSTLELTTAFFVVREGRWSEAGEILTFGEDSFAGGVALIANPTADAYASIEARFQSNGGTFTWVEAVSRSVAGGAWEVPQIVYSGPVAPDANRHQLNTGRIVATRRAAFLQWREGSPLSLSGANMANANPIFLKAATATVDLDTGTVDFGGTVDNGNGLNLELRVDIHSNLSHELMGTTPQTAHLSWRAPMLGEARRLVTAWWAFTNPGATAYTRARVYGSSTFVDQPRAQWKDAVTLSAPGQIHNSWPFLAQFADGSALCLWWSHDSESQLLSGVAKDYWVAHCDVDGVWQPGELVTPMDGEPLANITDVLTIDQTRVLVFSNQPGVGPRARSFDRFSHQWGPNSQPTTTFSIPVPYTNGKITSNGASANYGSWPNLMYQMTPIGARVDETRFLVEWSAGSGANARRFYSLLDSETMQWEQEVEFTLVQSVPVRDFGISANNLGWAIATWRELSTDGSGRSFAKAARANILVDGLEALGTSTAELLSEANGAATFPGRSNLHPTGALGVNWNLALPDPNNTTSPPLLGTMFSRFQ